MGSTGESARKVTDRGYNPCWSPDGLELAVADEQLHSPFGRGTTSHVWAVRVETGERRLLAGRDGIQPSWSPDGRRIAFWGVDDRTSARDLFTVAADGSQSADSAAVRVLDDPPVDWSPVWSADGRSLLFSSTRGGTMNLWRVGVDPSTGRPLGVPRPVTVPSSWAGNLSVSMDGRRIAFVDRNVRTSIRLASFDPAGGALSGTPRSAALGTIEVHDTVALSPDGGTVLFDDAGLPQHLYLLDARGGLRQLTEGPHRDRQGVFSPDGEWIVFQTDRWPSKLGVIRPDGSGLHALSGDQKASAFYPSWSPDGRSLVSGGMTGPFRIEVADGKAVGPAELFAPGRGGEARVLALVGLARRPDGRRLPHVLRERPRRERDLQLRGPLLPEDRHRSGDPAPLPARREKGPRGEPARPGRRRPRERRIPDGRHSFGGLADGAGRSLPRRPPPRLARARRRVGHLARRVRGEEVTTAPAMHMNHAYSAI